MFGQIIKSVKRVDVNHSSSSSSSSSNSYSCQNFFELHFALVCVFPRHACHNKEKGFSLSCIIINRAHSVMVIIIICFPIPICMTWSWLDLLLLHPTADNKRRLSLDLGTLCWCQESIVSYIVEQSCTLKCKHSQLMIPYLNFLSTQRIYDHVEFCDISTCKR